MPFQSAHTASGSLPPLKVPALGLELTVTLSPETSGGALTVIETVNAPLSVPGGDAHAFVNLPDKPARQLIMILPAIDAARFFTDLGEFFQQNPDLTR